MKVSTMPEEGGPLFNLKAVVQQTGLKPDTLRAWERRYNLITPQRTPKGHRLYTEDDVELIRQVLELLDQALGRTRTHYRFLPQRLQNPVAAERQTGSGLFVGKVLGGRKPYLSPRFELLAGDQLRVLRAIVEDCDRLARLRHAHFLSSRVRAELVDLARLYRRLLQGASDCSLCRRW